MRGDAVLPTWPRFAKWFRSRAGAETRTAYLLLAAPLGLEVFFGFFPIVLALVVSFVYWRPSRSYWVGIANYRDVLTSRVFWLAMRNAAIYTLLALPVGLVIALLLAGLIARLSSARVRSVYRGGLYLPGVVSGVVMTAIWFWIFSPSAGPLNGLLGLLGIQPVNWLGDRRVALFSLILMSWLSSHGSSVVVLSAAMTNIPRDFYESARLDGARWWDEFARITVPLIKPSLLFLVVTGTIGSFQIFGPVYLMTRGGPALATMTISYLIYQTAFAQFDFGVATAQTVLMALALMLLAWLQFRLMASEVEY